ncbi:feruloyl esterase B [Aulographum hederae CBS 113979]|uniref:Carboxylic ester hydrolase n=1 Tax=Aulographum hederae CBS 113979 TaxID=1176131 RepID=A0A6G1H046_9PEZI|nr:feruloyl esterase B [Aulographum hederae CBS 113979]
MRWSTLTAVLFAATPLVSALGPDAACTAEYFNSIIPKEAHTTIVQYVPQDGSFGEVGDIAYPLAASILPALCAVKVNVTTPQSIVTFGLMLPDNWNGRFLTVGNGGYTGGANWVDMGAGAQYGFAVMSSDLGHNGTAEDGAWQWGNPELMVDWSHRGLHNSVVLSKQIITKAYGLIPKYNYFMSCSNGGRQAMVESQMYPEDFDGIVAGAAPWWYTREAVWVLKTRTTNLPADAAHNIPPENVPFIIEAVAKQCDASDGLVDGIISEPNRCKLDIAAMGCDVLGTTNMSQCLTPPQMETMQKIYSDYYEGDEMIYPGVEVGFEPRWLEMYGPRPAESFASLFAGPLKDLYNQVSMALVIGEQAYGKRFNLDADNYDLSAFHARGGKFLSYHGWADQLIPPRASIHYYQNLRATMDAKGVNTTDFFRLMMIPGMGHCAGSLSHAPWYIAAGIQAWSEGTWIRSTPGYEFQKDYDILLKMMDWVENNQPIEKVIATEFKTGNLEALRQRPICIYPKVAVYKGCGNVELEHNWECRDPVGPEEGVGVGPNITQGKRGWAY